MQIHFFLPSVTLAMPILQIENTSVLDLLISNVIIRPAYTWTESEINSCIEWNPFNLGVGSQKEGWCLVLHLLLLHRWAHVKAT